MQTNFGEEYNRESMYETAREYFLDGKKVKINNVKCKTLIEVMLEDFRLEVDKERELLQQSEVALSQKNEKAFLDKFSQTMSRRKTTDNLQQRLEDAIKVAKQLKLEYNRVYNKFNFKKKTIKCTLEQLNDYLNELYVLRKRIVEYRINGDLTSTLSSKLLYSTNNYISEIEREISKKQICESEKEQ